MGFLKQAPSADIAARFVQRREAQRKRRYTRRREVARSVAARLSRLPAAAPDRAPQRRIALDLAEPTLRLIHDVLLDAVHANVDFGDRGALLMIAEQMVAQALGEPPCDDPPLTDREAT